MKQVLDEIIEKLPEEFNMLEIMNKVEERTPYVIFHISLRISKHSRGTFLVFVYLFAHLFISDTS